MDLYELYRGLPLRTIHIEKEEKDIVFGVSTGKVGELLNYFFDNNLDENTAKTFEEFDNVCSYFVPEEIFLSGDDEDIIDYINENIDDYVSTT